MSHACRPSLYAAVIALSLVARVATAELSEFADMSFSQSSIWRGVAGGDVNGDGVSDFVAASEAAVYVFLGSAAGLPSTPDWVITSSDSIYSVAVGDVNGDGFADIAAGAPSFGGSGGSGGVFVWLGGSDMATRPDGSIGSCDWHADSNIAVPATFGAAAFGASLALVDLDGDTIKDVVIGSPGWSFTNPSGAAGDGQVFVWLGRTGFGTAAPIIGIPGATPPVGPDWTAHGTANSPSGTLMGFGTSIGGSDVNGDGYADLLVGASNYAGGQVDEGAIMAFFGQQNLASKSIGTFNNAERVVEGGVAGAHLGLWVDGAGDVNGDGYGDVIAVASGHSVLPPVGPPEPGKWTLFAGGGPTLTPIWTKTSTYYQHYESGTAGDVNGDGLGDVLISQAGTGTGLDVHFGRQGVGPSITASATPFGGDRWRVAAIGDVNADGFGDIAAAYVLSVAPATYRVEVFYGGGYPTAIAVGASSFGSQLNSGYGTSVSTGDWNGDGFSDYVSGEPGFDDGEADEGRIVPVLGGPCKPDCPLPGLTPAGAWQVDQAGAQLGSSVAGVGDVNGDGFDDVVAGAPLFDGLDFGPGGFVTLPDSGAAFLYLGGVTGLGTSYSSSIGGLFSGHPAGGQLGFAVAAAGDVNGDGLSDVLVSAPYTPNGSLANAGRVELYLGDRVNLFYLAWSASGTVANEHFGIHVSTAGDVNRDGYSDVLVTGINYGASGESAAFLYLGRKGGLSATPQLTVLSASTTSDYGINVATAGDVNDDGFSDFAVGEPEWNGNQGRVRVFHGATGAAIGPAAVTLTGPPGGGRFGYGVSGGGDVNADGYGDLLVGEQWFSNPTFAEGRAHVYLGGPSGVSATQARESLADTPGDTSDFGRDVALNADFNGDGFADAIVGAFKTNHVLSDVGAVFVHFGGGGSGAPRAVRMRHFVPAGPLALRGIVSATESPGFAPVATLSSAYGRARMKAEVEVKAVGVPFDGLGLVSSTFLFTALAGTENQAAAVCTSSVGCHWRLRMRSTEPAFPVTPWISPPGNSRREADLRTFSDPDGDGVTESADLCVSVANPDQSNVDGDLFGNVCDNCPLVANDSQSDLDGDAVGDLCDCCRTIPNPKVPPGFLTANPWATLTGEQRDDDHDGWGNVCDADFPSTTQGGNVNAADLAQFRASNGHDRGQDDCGTAHNKPCAIFDLNLTQNTDGVGNINAADLARVRQLNGAPNPEKCPLCPMPCTSGTAGSCLPLPP